MSFENQIPHETPAVSGSEVEISVPSVTDWRKVHPLTPLAESWSVLLVIFAIILSQLGNADLLETVASLREWGYVWVFWLVLVGAILLILLLTVLFTWLSWKFTYYAVTDEAVLYRKGILFKTERHMRLNRIQAVDVVAPLVPRLLGLAKLHVDSAGDGDSKIDVAYLRAVQCQDLRAEVLAKAAGLKQNTGNSTIAAERDTAAVFSGAEGTSSAEKPAVHPGQDVSPPRSAGVSDFVAGIGSVGAVGELPAAQGQAPELPLYEIAMPMLLGSIMRSLGTWMIFLLIPLIALSAAAPALGMYLSGEVDSIVMGLAVAPQALLGGLAGLIAVGAALFQQINNGWNFTAAISPDGIRLRHGLTTHDSQTIPPGRVHAVVLVQPFLWRKKDWWKVSLTMAGYQGGDSSKGSSTVLLPVGTRSQALQALWMMEKNLGVVTDLDGCEIGTSGTDLLNALMYGSGPAPGVFAASRRAKWLDWITWNRKAAVLTSTMVMIREGRITRRASFVPHARLQSVAVYQGPLQRRLDLATVRLHLVPGSVPTKVKHQEMVLAEKLWELQVSRADTARDNEGPAEWMRRVTTEQPDAMVSPRVS